MSPAPKKRGRFLSPIYDCDRIEKPPPNERYHFIGFFCPIRHSANSFAIKYVARVSISLFRGFFVQRALPLPKWDNGDILRFGVGGPTFEIGPL